ncbi:MAG TPA: SDR family oxidoreductase [Candidatus Binatia bacterium]|nr:SDR family oxidoreductase [Candidatus Binatia bacterium]
MIDLAGRRILVTGGGSGIGRAIALGACSAGADVVIAGRRTGVLDEVAAAASGSGRISAVPADIGDAASVTALVAACRKRLDGIDGLVHAAGVHSIGESLALDDEELERVLQTNLVGAFRVTREVGRVMLEAGAGSIVEIASLSSYGGFPGRLAYAVSKAGLLEMTRTLAAEWGRRGVRINALVPGFVRTAIQDSLIERGLLDVEALEARTPLGRRAEADDMVQPALFLLSDAARFVTGHGLLVDGGWLSFVGPVDRYSGTVSRP